jgi:DnaK suppressor protein
MSRLHFEPRTARDLQVRVAVTRGPLECHVAVDADRARALLAAERGRIERELVELVHADEGVAAEEEEFDAANLAPELLQDELAEGRAEDLHEQLAAVTRAEQRLAAGTYGLSIESGEPIPDERLEVVPTAELTVTEEHARSGR